MAPLKPTDLLLQAGREKKINESEHYNTITEKKGHKIIVDRVEWL